MYQRFLLVSFLFLSIGCIAQAQNSYSRTVTAENDLRVILDIVEPTCAGYKNGSITARTEGGQPPFSFRWSNGNRSSNIFGLAAGTYGLTITDGAGIERVTAQTVLLEPDPLLIDIEAVGDLCEVDEAGFQVNVSGGTAPYTYNWSDGSTSATLSNPTSGNYFLTVTDDNGCQAVEYLKVNPPLEVKVVAQAVRCADFCDASVTAMTTGGQAPLSYVWNTGDTTQIVDMLPVGVYTVTVTDGNGCSVTASGEVTGPPPINAMVEVDNTCEADGDISAEVTASGGEGDFFFLWSTGAVGTRIGDLERGEEYFVVVFDANECNDTVRFTVPEAPNLVLEGEKMDVTCTNINNGSITANVMGGTAPYTFVWSNGEEETSNENSSTIDELPAGTYSVTVTDAEGCTSEITLEVEANGELEVETASTPTTCVDDADGMANAIGMGGTGTYSYLWSDGQTTGTAINLAAGTYTVTVTDVLFPSCQVVETVTVSSIGISGININVDTTGSTVVIATPIDGRAPYAFEWSNGEDGPIATGYAPCDSYSVTVTDSDGCVQEASGEIPCDNSLDVDIETTPTCEGQEDGTATLTIEGGTEPYTIDWGNGNTDVTNTGLAAGGPYQVIITDADGEQRIINYIIGQINLNVDVDVVQQTCNTDEGGSILLEVEGDNAPFTFEWSDDSLEGDSLTNVPLGTYTVTITDANGCVQERTIEVTEEQGVTSTTQVTPSDCGEENGSIAIIPSGRNTPFMFEWSTGDTTARLVNVAPGEYSYTVTDANGCTDEQTVTVTEEINIDINTTIVPATCEEGNDGSIAIEIDGGTAPYVYQINGDTVGVETTGLGVGDYDILVTDANGCQKSSTVTIDQDNDIEIEITATIDEDTQTGTLTAVASGGAGNYVYLWSNGTTTATISNLPPGCYEVTVTDENGCFKTASADIIGMPEIVIEPNCDGTATVSTNLAACLNANITWSNGDTGNSTTLSEGDQSVTISFDGNDEDINIDFAIEAPNLEIESSGVTSATCDDADGSATVSVLEGTGNYNFVWMLGDSVIAAINDSEENSSTLDNLGEGTYTVMVTDANGCEQETIITIAAENSIDVTIADVSVCAGEEVNIEVNNNGDDDLNYEWTPADLFVEGTANSENPTFIGTESATVNVLITNEAGCEQERSVNINVQEPTAPDADQITYSETCLGFEITFDGNGQTNGYTWRFGDPNNSNDISQNGNPVYTYSEAGTFTVTLIPTDAGACQDTAMFEVIVEGEQELDFNITGEPLACGQETSTFSVDDTELTVEWYAAIDLDNPISTLNSAALAAGDYVVRVENELGCIGEQTYSVEDKTVNIDLLDSYCTCGGEELGVTISSLSDEDELIFDWSPNDPNLIDLTDPSNPIFILEETTTFTTTVSNQFGCSVTREVTIEVGQEPIIDAIFPDKDTIALGESTNIRIEGAQGNYSYRWINDPSLNRLDIADPSAAPTETTTYTVEIFNEDDPCGCVLIRNVQIVVLDLPCEDPYVFIPTAFTPNGDGINDVLRVYGPHIERLNLEIYNRWGELVFETDDVDGEWNGNHRRTGQPAEGRTFAYVLSVECIGGETYTKRGNVTILR
jgi:gliding motility-associated-like protein